jgi:hypothetical protein
VIDLAANNLTSLDYRIFFPLNNLSNLDMSFNKLSTVDDQSAKWMLDIETAINLIGTCSQEFLTGLGVVAYRVPQGHASKGNIFLLIGYIAY